MRKDQNVIDRRLYENAATFAPPKLAARLTGAISDGYWLDERRYFFCVAEGVADGAIVSRPKIADAVAGTVTPVIAAEALVATIAEGSDKPFDGAALAFAQYDMPDGDTLVVTIGLDAFHVAIASPKLIKAETLEPLLSLHSPDGRYAAFLKGHAVWIKDRATGTAHQLTPDGEPYHAYGAAPEAGIGPLSGRKMPIPSGLWSADSEWFATHRIDERHMPESGLVEHVPAGGKRAVPHIFKVSSPDADLATAEFVAYHVPSGRAVVATDRRVSVNVISPFVVKQCWFAGDNLYFLDWDRFSTEVSLIEMRLADGATRTALHDKVEDGWIDIHPFVLGQPMVRILPASNALIWWSEVDGHGHLYLHDLATGERLNQITAGDWMVREIVHVDEAKRRILFLASGFEGGDPGHRRLCSVDFDGRDFSILVTTDGDIGATPDPIPAAEQLRPFRPPYAGRGVSPDGSHIVFQTGAIDTATETRLVDPASGRETRLARSNIDALWTAPKPQPFEVLAADGVTTLHGALLLPTDFDPDLSYPLVDHIYPGPQVNWLSRRFPSVNAPTLQAVVELGAIGILLETRGMPNRSRAFHQAGQGRMLEPQLSDHVAAIEQLCQRHRFIDRDRVGIFGYSGGGYATARALFDYPEVFKVGVAICGNHENRNYVAQWIDKYGPRPGTAERADQSNIDAAGRLQGKLFLIHGDMDDNVHPAHTLALSAALIAAGKDFDQLIVPNATHAVMSESPFANQRIWNFFVRHLIGAEPPSDFSLNWTRAEAGAASRMFADSL